MNPDMVLAKELLRQRIEIDDRLARMGLVVENNTLRVQSCQGRSSVTEVDLLVDDMAARKASDYLDFQRFSHQLPGWAGRVNDTWKE